MAKKPETAVKLNYNRNIEALIKKLGLNIWHEKIQQVTKRGTPDDLGCIGPCGLCGRGLFLATELKIPGEKPDPLQELKLRKIKDAGGCSLVYKTSADLAVLEEYLSLERSEPKTLRSLMEYLIAQGALKEKL
jgi:hypothetical protein